MELLAKGKRISRIINKKEKLAKVEGKSQINQFKQYVVKQKRGKVSVNSGNTRKAESWQTINLNLERIDYLPTSDFD